ncbi:dihydrofolate reductase [Fimbriiglobus ruber]|uniref:dihydrofolate reductase n=1 Tax=Fimbriiglobus ruber TaxID=1908690 RepID=UPI00137B22DE|nr:dihydrofolate reductase [Fimbriiglobus ruber]
MASDRTGLIGTDTGLPWHLPGDLRRFRAVTMGKPIVMGRKTRDSIGRALPGRFNIVLTHNPDYRADDTCVVNTPAAAITQAVEELKRTGGNEVMVIGGAEIYRVFFPRADRVYLTLVDGEFAGTTRFPTEKFAHYPFTATSETVFPADEKNAHACRILILDRTESGPAWTWESIQNGTT